VSERISEKAPPLPHPLNIAHRGASAYAPENTLASIQKAMDMGADIIELDLHQTKDGVPVVLHDTSLWRTAGIRRNVGSLTLKEIQKLDVGRWFNPKFENQRIPTLQEVLEMVQDRVTLNLELKQGTSPYPNFTDNIIHLLNQCHLFSKTLISSFHHGTIQRIRKDFPEAFLGYLSHREATSKIFSSAIDLKAYSLHIPFRKISPALLDKSHSRGFQVFCYTVNHPDEMKRFLKMGVDGLFTNYPDRLAKLITESIER
jgi:glycerophosphoryl diester phosphodiesterase